MVFRVPGLEERVGRLSSRVAIPSLYNYVRAPGVVGRRQAPSVMGAGADIEVRSRVGEGPRAAC